MHEILSHIEGAQRFRARKMEPARAELLERVNVDYPYLEKVFSSMPLSEATPILNGLDSTFRGENGRLLQRALELPFDIDPTLKEDRTYYFANYSAESVDDEAVSQAYAELADNPYVQKLLAPFWDIAKKEDGQGNPNDEILVKGYKFALALILSKLPYSSMPFDLQERVGNPLFYNYEVLAAKDQWFLCEESEQRMLKAVRPELEGAVLVNDSLLVKVIPGKLTAVCLKPITTPSGFLVPGVWYSPDDDKSVRRVEEAFYRGDTSLQYEGFMSWIAMRPVEGRFIDAHPVSTDSFMKNIRKEAASLPQKAPELIFLDKELSSQLGTFQNGYCTRKEARKQLREAMNFDF